MTAPDLIWLAIAFATVYLPATRYDFAYAPPAYESEDIGCDFDSNL